LAELEGRIELFMAWVSSRRYSHHYSDSETWSRRPRR